MIVRGDARLLPLRDGCVQCVVTSPPYWGGVRDYGHVEQLGMERNPDDYVAALVSVFDECWRVLDPGGCLWLNMGEVYAASGKGGGGNQGDRASWSTIAGRTGYRGAPEGFKPKDITLTPFRAAEALRSRGWYLRATIIWRKPSAVEPLRLDRPALSHEYVFMFAKSEQYDARSPNEQWWGHSVWDITPHHTAEHPATMPVELARRCIVASCPVDGLVMDPFCGSGTTGIAAVQEGRRFIGVELNEEYATLARRRVLNAPLNLFGAA